MTSPIDYNQHLLAYLQAWRQLLEASAAMTSSLPFQPTPYGMAPAPMPFVPPTVAPWMSPAGASPSTDYAQQLFGYLQAWRQYLEQAIGAPQVGPGPTTAPQPGSQPTSPPPATAQSAGTQSASAQSAGTQSTWPPKLETVPPRDDYGAISVNDFGSRFKQLLDSGSETTRLASADRIAGSAFAEKASRVGPEKPPQAATRSLYFSRAADTASVTGPQAAQDPRRAAPPAAARWWEAGQGRRPGFKEQPASTNIRDVPPIQEFGPR